MTTAQLHVMQKGRERAAKVRRRRAIARVATFKSWSAKGGDVATIPEIPSDYDWRLWRESQAHRKAAA